MKYVIIIVVVIVLFYILCLYSQKKTERGMRLYYASNIPGLAAVLSRCVAMTNLNIDLYSKRIESLLIKKFFQENPSAEKYRSYCEKDIQDQIHETILESYYTSYTETALYNMGQKMNMEKKVAFTMGVSTMFYELTREFRVICEVFFYLGTFLGIPPDICLKLIEKMFNLGQDDDRMKEQVKQAYATLGVSEDATQAEIAAAKRKLLNKWHPDRAPEDKVNEYTIKSQEINAAYDLICAYNNW